MLNQQDMATITGTNIAGMEKGSNRSVNHRVDPHFLWEDIDQHDTGNGEPLSKPQDQHKAILRRMLGKKVHHQYMDLHFKTMETTK
jgi:hypothetical protein